MAAYVERRAACGASYNACASGATPRKFETRQPARPAGKAKANRQFQRRVGTPATNASPTTPLCCQATVAIDSEKLRADNIGSVSHRPRHRTAIETRFLARERVSRERHGSRERDSPRPRNRKAFR